MDGKLSPHTVSTFKKGAPHEPQSPDWCRLGAVVGALVWGGIAHATGYEIGYVAWGIGALIGGLGRGVGGGGQMNGIVCALFALASIFVGKMLAVKWAVDASLDDFAVEFLTQERYEEQLKDAEDFAEVQSDTEYTAFMISHGYTEHETDQEIPDEEYWSFVDDTVPHLQWIHSEQPTISQWRDRFKEEIKGGLTNEDLAEEARSSLGVIDIIFGLLGIGTAYKLAASGE